MEKCICCGDEATFPGWGSNPPEICYWCACNLPLELVIVAKGRQEKYIETRTYGVAYAGTWTKDNWQEYPSLVEHKKELFGKGLTMTVTCPDLTENKYPHICPKCGAPAYCGLVSLDCSKGCK